MRLSPLLIAAAVAFPVIASAQTHSCAPYVCADGTNMERCSADGSVIHYVVNPCTTHGGDYSDRIFIDVLPDMEFAEAVSYLKDRGVIQGYGHGDFRPYQLVNRAEFVKIVMTAIGADSTSSSACFNDFSRDANKAEWYYGYACAAKQAGLIDGYPDGTFHGERHISIEEASKIIANAFRLPAMQTDIWYEGYMRALSDRKALPMSLIGLREIVNRAQMAEMIYRLSSGRTDLSSRTYEDFVYLTWKKGHGGLPFGITNPTAWGMHNQTQYEVSPDYWSYPDLQGDGRGFSVSIFVTDKEGGLQFRMAPCGEMVCPEDTDFDTYRKHLESSMNLTVESGIRMKINDSYHVPSGTFHRAATFFIGDQMVSISAGFEIGLYNDEYVRRNGSTHQFSLSEIVYEDIEGYERDPINRVFAVYPDETREEQKFLAEFDAAIRTIR